MIQKIVLISLLTACSFQVFSQSYNLEDLKEFYCYEWLPEFRDSILVYANIESIDQENPYCALVKERRYKYDLFCWTGSKGLELPTKWKDELKIKFKRESLLFKFGNRRVEYCIITEEEGAYLLVKK